MNKIFLIVLILLASRTYAQKSVYDLAIDKADGTSEILSVFKTKKIVIAVFPVSQIDDTLEHYLDSLQTNRPDIAVILQPGLSDNSAAVDSSKVIPLTTKAVSARANQYRKSSGVNQGNLARWLSSDALNGHFGTEFSDNGNFFFIDQSGQLVGVSAGIPSTEYMTLMLDQVATTK